MGGRGAWSSRYEVLNNNNVIQRVNNTKKYDIESFERNNKNYEIIYYEDKLIVMLNYKSPKFQEMSNRLMGFFDR